MTLRASLCLLLLTACHGIASAAPVSITCNGPLYANGRPAGSRIYAFRFQFDQANQTMTLEDQALKQVSVTDALASGRSKDEFIWEINRIAGSAVSRADDEYSRKNGLNGAYFRGICAIAGQAKF